MMKKDWIPSTGDCVVLDTNIVNFARRKAYKSACTQLLTSLARRGVKLVIPQIVEYELLRHSENMAEYQRIKHELERQFKRWPIDEGIFQAAILMQCLYHWHEMSRKFSERRDTLADMLVAATAGKHQVEQQCRTYILSGDQDYALPYVFPVAQYELEHNEKSTAPLYVHFFEIYVDQVNRDWKNQLESVGQAAGR